MMVIAELGDNLDVRELGDGTWGVFHTPTGAWVAGVSSMEQAHNLASALGPYFRVVGPSSGGMSLEQEMYLVGGKLEEKD